MPASSGSFAFLAFLVALVVVVAGVGIGLLYEHNRPGLPSGPQTVAVGDNITVNYIGIFGSGPEVGKVFDTSIESVAKDNTSYPKSLEYSPRNASGYTPLPVHVGPNVPSGGYKVGGLTFGGVVTGFWKGLVGLTVNETHYIPPIPASEGYGPLNASCLETAPLVSTVPTVVVYTPSGFKSTFGGVVASAGVTFTDPTYGWTDRVLSVNATAVGVLRLPVDGQSIDPFGWTMLVSNVTSATITLQSELTPADVGSVAGTIPGQTFCGSSEFLLWGVDLSGGTFTENYNRETIGVTLIFLVTVVAIE